MKKETTRRRTTRTKKESPWHRCWQVFQPSCQPDDVPLAHAGGALTTSSLPRTSAAPFQSRCASIAAPLPHPPCACRLVRTLNASCPFGLRAPPPPTTTTTTPAALHSRRCRSHHRSGTKDHQTRDRVRSDGNCPRRCNARAEGRHPTRSCTKLKLSAALQSDERLKIRTFLNKIIIFPRVWVNHDRMMRVG